MMRLICFILLLTATFSVSDIKLNWRRVGPNAGNIYQIVADRDHPNIYYLVESQFRRLYRSTDSGENWKYTGFNNVTNLVVHSASSELFVVSGRRYENKFSLFSSNNFGRTFTLRSANSPNRIFDHPSDPKILWGSGVDDPYELSVSTDGGAHWKGFYNLPYKFEKKYEIHGWQLSPSEYYLSSILVSPLDQKTIYVSTEVFFDIGCSGEVIDLELVSTNFGKTWDSAEVPAVRYIYDKAFPTRAFAVNNWETRTLTSRGWKNLAKKGFSNIASVPGNINFLYGTLGSKQWFSRDGGIEWRNVDIGPAGLARTIVARSFPEGGLIAGTSGGGVYVIDEKSRWRPSTGLHEARVVEVLTSHDSSTVYATAGNDDHFLYRSTDSAATWKNITENLQPLVRPAYGHLYRSPDGGRTIFELPPEYGYRNNSIQDLAVDPFTGDFYVATVRGLFRSKGPLQKPEQIATEIASDCWSCSSFDQVIALPAKGQLLVNVGGRLYKSTNHGVSWQKISSGIGKIYVADNKGLHLYHIAGRLYESFDGGITWNNASASIHPRLDPNFDQYISSMSDPRHRPIYVSTSLGIFQGK